MTTDQFRLSGAWNYRDVGGLRTVDGRTVRTGVLHRASALLRLDDDGRRSLIDLGITDVFDLRGDREVEHEGADVVPDQVRVHRLPYVLRAGPKADDDRAPHEAPRVIEASDAQAHMLESYSRFPTLDGARTAIRSVIDAIVTGNGGVLVHCAAGKDRAGWTVATVLRAAGVTEDDVLADYLLSNDAIEPLRQHVVAVWGDSPRVAQLTDDMLGVREEYYRAGIAAMEREYGSFEGYLEALGVDATTLVQLRHALLFDTTMPTDS